jgi:hypothetical protein
MRISFSLCWLTSSLQGSTFWVEFLYKIATDEDVQREMDDQSLRPLPFWRTEENLEASIPAINNIPYRPVPKTNNSHGTQDSIASRILPHVNTDSTLVGGSLTDCTSVFGDFDNPTGGRLVNNVVEEVGAIQMMMNPNGSKEDAEIPGIDQTTSMKTIPLSTPSLQPVFQKSFTDPAPPQIPSLDVDVPPIPSSSKDQLMTLPTQEKPPPGLRVLVVSFLAFPSRLYNHVLPGG